MTTTPRKAGLYERISDDREGLELGVDRQDEDLRAAAAREGDIVVDVYRDNDLSASTRSRKSRPEYGRMLADARAGRITRIRAYSASRLTRRPREHEDLIELAERHGVDFRYAQSPSFDLSTADGRQVARMLAAADAAEAERTGERVSRKKRQMAEQGAFLGGFRSFGFAADGLTAEPVEAAAKAEGFRAVLAGESLAGIASRWNSRFTTPRGGPFTAVAVRQTLLVPRNAGAIVPPDQWAAVRAVLLDPSRTTTPGTRPKWLGAGIFVCGGCDRPTMRSSGRTGSRLYRCSHAGDGQQHASRTAQRIDDLVERLLVARLAQPDAVNLLPQLVAVDLAPLRTERAAKLILLAEVDADRDSGLIDRARWLKRNAELTGRLTAIEVELARARESSPLAGLPLGDGEAAMRRHWFGVLPDRSDGLSLERRRKILRALAKVTIETRGRGWKPSRFPQVPADLGIAIEPLSPHGSVKTP